MIDTSHREASILWHRYFSVPLTVPNLVSHASHGLVQTRDWRDEGGFLLNRKLNVVFLDLRLSIVMSDTA